MATLYLHIGMPKTGTTAIQRFCVRNRRALRRRGYCFPQSPLFHPNISRERNGRLLVSVDRTPDGSFASPQAATEWRGYMDFLAAQFRKCPNVILSDEGIWNSRNARSGMWRDLKAEAEARGFEIRVIAYLRRQDQFLQAAWAQWVRYPPKPGTTLVWADMTGRAEEIARLDYYEALEEIAGVVGRERITVRVYDRSRFPDGNIVSDFLGILGLPLTGEFRAVGERNPSLSGDELEIVRVLDAMPNLSPEAQQAAVRIATACRAGEDGRAKPSLFSAEEARAFLGRYEKSNRRVAEEYLGDGSGRLFPKPEDLGPKWEPGTPGMYEAIIRFFATAVFAPPRVRLQTRLRRRLRRLRCRLWEMRVGN